MGYATIVGGGEDGRYTIAIDIGESARASLVARFSAHALRLQEALAIAQNDLNQANANASSTGAAYTAATEEFIQLMRGEIDLGEGEEAAAEFLRINEAYASTQKEFFDAKTKQTAAVQKKNAASLSLTTAQKAISDWQAQVLTETRDAWCVDFTEDATGYVATLEIPGESELILIAPGGRPPVTLTDGNLFSRGLMAPWQAYFNASVLPGWQKFKPTYRWGTITAINQEADVVDVSLFDSKSSAQRLPVNQTASLAAVPVDYMGVGASIFEVGDNVVVRFVSQDWQQPRVIGFLDNPRPPGKYELIGVTFTIPDRYASTGGFYARDQVYWQQVIAWYNAEALTAKYRINRGAWTDLTLGWTGNLTGARIFRDESLPAGNTDVLFLTLTPTFGGYQMIWWLEESIVSPGDVGEYLILHGTDIVANFAVLDSGNAPPLSIAISGSISSADGTPTTRLDYDLFEKTGN